MREGEQGGKHNPCQLCSDNSPQRSYRADGGAQSVFVDAADILITAQRGARLPRSTAIAPCCLRGALQLRIAVWRALVLLAQSSRATRRLP